MLKQGLDSRSLKIKMSDFKHAEEELPLVLVEAVRLRLTQGRLVVLDYYLLLVQGRDRELQELVLEQLEPQDAASVMSMASISEENWEALEYAELSQEGRFFAWAEVAIQGELQTTVTAGCDKRKQAAKHQACVLWLTAFVRGELVGPEAQVLPEEPVAVPESGADSRLLRLQGILSRPLLDGQNHVGTLTEICQFMEWEMPSFEFEQRDDGFYCRCSCIWFGDTVVGDAIAGKKKLAKSRAALDLLRQMQGRSLDIL
jgi:ribonuclease R